LTRYLKTLLKLTLVLGICGAFLWATFRGIDLHRFWQEVQQARPSWLIPTALLLLLSNLPRAWRWQILMAPISRDISLWRTFVAVLIGYAGNNLFPRAGEVARVIAVKQDRDLPISGLLATVVVERIIDMLVLAALFGIALLFFRTEIARIDPRMETAALITLLVSLLLMILFGVLSLYGERTLTVLQRIFGGISHRLADRLVEMMRSFFQGMEAIRTVAGYAEIFISTLLLSGIYILAVYLPFLAFNFPERYGLDLAAALVVMAISTVGIVLPSLGGIGTYHYFCSQSLYHLYGVPLDEAVAFATVLHSIAYLTFLITGGPGLVSLLLRRSRSFAPRA
jgi:uncharacterized protein (TIRG00374 family)